MAALELYDVVEATSNLDDIVRSGTRGAIVMVYPCIPAEYEVEFMDEQGNTLAICTVKGSQLHKIATPPKT